MIHFTLPPEPADFDRKARRPGNAWLARNVDKSGRLPKGKRPPDRWSDFKWHLADAFHNLCAYSAMRDLVGVVDHYLSCGNHPKRAYEWRNYRYASAWINCSKGTEDEKVLDPLEVQDDWFQVLLPSLQLVLTDRIPAEQRQRAQYTLERLHLRDDERVIRQRRAWYSEFESGGISLNELERVAPLIARAVRRQQDSGQLG